jgi:hypothetical protein
MTFTSSTNDDILVLLCVFNILSASIAFFLHFRLVTIVKRLKRGNAYTFEVLKGLETSCDNWVNQTKKLRSMLKTKHNLLEIDIQGIVPQIKETIKSEFSHQTKVLNKSYDTTAGDSPTLSIVGNEWDDDYVSIEGFPVIGRCDGEIEMTGVPINRLSCKEECHDDGVSL